MACCLMGCGPGDTGSGGAAGTAGTMTTGGSAGTGGTAGTMTTGGAGSGASCAAGETCMGAAPADWKGPVVVYKGDVAMAAPDCPPAFDAVALDAFEGLGAADPAVCTCTCGDPTGAKCTSSSSEKVQKVPSNQAACGNSCGGASPLFDAMCLPVIQGTCGGQMLPTISQSVSLSPPDLAAAQCAPSLDKTVPPAPSFASKVRVCVASSLPACTGGVCVSGDHGAYGAAACVMHDGDVACPDTVYTSKTLVHTSADDTRDCEPCACGAPAGVSCTGTMTAHSSAGCGDNLGSWPVPGCVPWLPAPGTKYIRFNLSATGGTCAPSGGAPVGDVSAQGPTTICCTP